MTLAAPQRRFPVGFAADFVRTHGLTTATEEAEWRRRRRVGQLTRDDPTFIKYVARLDSGLGSPNSFWTVVEPFTVERELGSADTHTFFGRSMVLAIVREVVELPRGSEVRNLCGGLFAALPDGSTFSIFCEPMPLEKLAIREIHAAERP
jgi:hypothetical protein